MTQERGPVELDLLLESTAQQYRAHPTKGEDGRAYTLITAAEHVVEALGEAGTNIPELTGVVVSQTTLTPAEAFEGEMAYIVVEGKSWRDFFSAVLTEVVWHEAISRFPDLDKEDGRRLDAQESETEY